MNLPFHKNRLSASRRFLFPLFSLFFHLGFFLFFMAVGVKHPSLEIKDEEIVAMIDLRDLPPPLKPPEPTLPLESPETIPEENPEPEAGAVPESPVAAPEPILDPELDEVVEEDVPETGLPAPIETAQNLVIPQAPPLAEATRPDAALPEPVAVDSLAEAEPAPAASDLAAAGSPEPEPEPEALGEETHAAKAEPAPPAAPVATTPESAPATSAEPMQPSAQEVAKASEVQDPPKPSPEKKVVAAIKKPVPPPPPPKAKPSKEKVKKSGLLGLLGNKTQNKPLKNPLFTKGLKRPKRERLNLSPPKVDAVSTESRLKMARLKSKLLKSEEHRLMKKRSVGRKKKSQLKIVQGSGRNFGVISSAIAQEEWRLTTVYNRLLQQNPGLQGNLIIEFTISPQGKVIKSHILTSSFANSHFEKALIQAIRLWKFPAAKEGETTILYPLAFSPAG